MNIKELDKDLIHRANSNSFSGTRGDVSAEGYKSYINEVLSWEIPDTKKQKILDKLYIKYSEVLKYEAQHVSVMVAGPAKYNSRKLDKSDIILQKSHEFCKWFDDLREQIKDSKTDTNEKVKDNIISMVEFCISRGFDPKNNLIQLANIDNKKFIELYEKYNETYNWRKNTNIYKMYQLSLEGKVKEIKKEIIFEDENFTAYILGDRAYIRFPMKIQQQLIYALKKKGWWWNTHQKAWSTYLNRVDKEWIESISTKYSSYL